MHIHIFDDHKRLSLNMLFLKLCERGEKHHISLCYTNTVFIINIIISINRKVSILVQSSNSRELLHRPYIYIYIYLHLSMYLSIHSYRVYMIY